MAVSMRDSRALWLLTVLGIVGALYVAKAVFIPLALAVLLTFVLAPPARLLRQWGLPRVPAALIVVPVAFISIACLVLALGQQLNQLASELPKYEYTITHKIQNIRAAVANIGTLQSMSQLLNHVNQEISPKEGASVSHPEQPQPTPVQVVEASPAPVEVVRRYIEPVLDPITTSVLILLYRPARRRSPQNRTVGFRSQRRPPPRTTGLSSLSAGPASSTIRSRSYWRSCSKNQECKRGFNLTLRYCLCISLNWTRRE
jgi:hypothetical protein